MCIIRVVPIEVTIAILILTLLALPIGNFLLITAYVRMKEKRMLLIANRAASDLLVTVIVLRLLRRWSVRKLPPQDVQFPGRYIAVSLDLKLGIN